MPKLRASYAQAMIEAGEVGPSGSETFRDQSLRRLTSHAGSGASHILPMDRAGEGLYCGLRQGALDYFSEYSITWWLSRDEAVSRRAAGVVGLPTGHLTSSQLACVNHLEPARNHVEIALQVARQVDPSVDRVLFVPGERGFVAFEWLPKRDLLNESTRRTRGANVTSLDALMLGQRRSGKIVVLAFEWKFLETYGQQAVARVSKAGTDRLARYQALLDDPSCPVKRRDPGTFFYEPYYQLMRQTLLAWQMTRDAIEGWPTIDDWRHVQVIPAGNLKLRRHVPHAVSDYAGHKTLESAWRSVLKSPNRYRVVTPTDLMPTDVPAAWHDWRRWARSALRHVGSTVLAQDSRVQLSALGVSSSATIRATASKMCSRRVNISASRTSACRANPVSIPSHSDALRHSPTRVSNAAA